MTQAVPDVATLESVLDTAARAPSIRNAQPWRWHVGRDGMSLLADWERRLGDTDADRRDVILSCGAVMHHCVVALAAAGWRTRIQRYRTPRDTGALAFIEFIERPARAGADELAAAIPARRADRRRFETSALPAATLELLYIRAARMGVRLAVVPAERWARRGDGEVVLRFADESARDHDDDAVLLAFATDSDDAAARLLAGEALSHIALTATAMGYATCPVTEPLAGTRERMALACEVFDGEGFPQTLLRLGRAPVDGEPLPPVARRSVAETTTWDPAVR
ncbi:nitroreductase [Mycobacterium sp. MYCO198283]|uniref:nitroreductase n=1 Tax=Mycobacterium sp. MYCO198283 TaxID=2883505 RepID=UPI001E462709|nr:nitroreductase [Mycobacterium sp. MYCO198283]MCG5433306.1 nitroreductase [Mycobacterium sp. MYCO198283]